jgi:hypothetical protein
VAVVLARPNALGDQENIYVLIAGEVIVHAARDWLDWAVAREATRRRN